MKKVSVTKINAFYLSEDCKSCLLQVGNVYYRLTVDCIVKFGKELNL